MQPYSIIYLTYLSNFPGSMMIDLWSFLTRSGPFIKYTKYTLVLFSVRYSDWQYMATVGYRLWWKSFKPSLLSMSSDVVTQETSRSPAHLESSSWFMLICVSGWTEGGKPERRDKESTRVFSVQKLVTGRFGNLCSSQTFRMSYVR